jgi:hypothetical protein
VILKEVVFSTMIIRKTGELAAAVIPQYKSLIMLSQIGEDFRRPQFDTLQ